jgi:hypothetical protein
MKRYIVMAMVLCLAIAPVAGAQADKAAGKLGVGINGGLMIPTSGDITADSSLNDFFKAGPAFGAHINYTFVPQFSVRGGFTYTFMKMKDEVIGSDTEEPYFTTPYAYIDGILNIGGFMKSENNIFNPYIVAGGGLYFWKVTDDGAGGDAALLDNDEEWKKTSFGVHFGPGVEIYATPALSIFAEAKYHILFAKDEDKFGVDFKNPGMIDVIAGLTYHFPIAGK